MLLAICLICIAFTLTNRKKCRGGGNSCNYSQACFRPSTSDRNHLVDTTAIYNITTMQCQETWPVSAPRDCKKFETLDDCRLCCGNANVTDN